jgi:hypothetical protein
MFAHEGIALITLFSILVVGALAAVLHPLHALAGWIRSRRVKSTRLSKEADSR